MSVAGFILTPEIEVFEKKSVGYQIRSGLSECQPRAEPRGQKRGGSVGTTLAARTGQGNMTPRRRQSCNLTRNAHFLAFEKLLLW